LGKAQKCVGVKLVNKFITKSWIEYNWKCVGIQI
jgi:hypothetical protein